MQELSDELLSHVAGGLTAREERELRDNLKMIKDHGTPLEYVLGLVDNAPTEEERQECRDYILRNWDLI